MASKRKHPAVIFTDDAWILGATEKPVTIQDLKEQVVDSYAGTGGALWWSVGDHEVYHYETQVGEIFGAGFEELDPESHSFVHTATPGVGHRLAQNIRSLMESGGGPLQALVELCGEAGLPFFPRVRMNSHYEIDPAHPAYGRFRREHPELLIGRPGEDIPEGTVEGGLRTGKNYAFPEVCAYMAAVIFEVFERFDVDGVELDFMRHPGFFRLEEAYANRYLMTDLVRHVHQRLLQVSTERGKELLLAVRVPPTLADSTRVGVDVAQWMDEGLVDIVVVGGGFIPFETPVEEFVRAARGTDCLIYGCIEATRYIDEKHLRALASRWWHDGADGIYLYNFYTMAAEWNQRIFEQLSDPAAMTRLDKCYGLDRAGAFFPCSGHSCGFRYASPSTQLPVALEENFEGRGPALCIAVADDLELARADNALGTCGLTLRLDHFTADDRLEVRLNQVEIPWSSGRVSFDGWKRLQIDSLFWSRYPTYPVEVEQPGISVEYEISAPPLGQGENQVEVRLVSKNPRQGEKVVLLDVQISINYRDE